MHPVRLHLPAGMAPPPSPRSDPVAHAHRSLGAALSEYVMPGEEAEAARALLACVDGGRLDLAGLDEAYAHLPFVMEVPAWKALREAVAALSLGPVTEVHAGQADSEAEFNLLAIGLGLLRELREVYLSVPREGSNLRLTGLHQEPPPRVHLDCPRANGLLVTAREGLVLETSGEAFIGQIYMDRPERITVDAKGREVAREPLAGAQFFTPPPPEALVAGGDRHAAQEILVETDLNLRRPFPDTPEARRLGLVDTPQACRHFALAYGCAQQAYEREQAHLPPQARRPFSLVPAGDSKGICVADPPPWTERAYREVMATQAVALASDAGFGSAMAHLCDTLAPSQARVFVVRAFDHLMALKLARAPGPTPLFQVSFYDPCRTLTDQGLWVRASADLERLSLADFLPDWDLEAQGWDPEIAVIYDCPAEPLESSGTAGTPPARGPGPAAPQPLGLFGPFLVDEPQADWLSFLVPANAIVPVMRAVGAVPEPGSEAGLAVLQAGADAGYPALHVACRRGAADGVAAYVAAVLAIPPEGLGQADRVALLRGIIEDDEAHPALYHAFERSPRAVAMFARGVLTAPAAVLDASGKRALVAASDEAGHAREVVLAIEGSRGRSEADRERVAAGVLAWAHEVLAATALPLPVLRELLAAAGVSAQVAMAPAPRDGKHEVSGDARETGDPTPAAALLCAVLESPLAPAQRAQVLEATGLSPVAVAEALAAQTDARAPQALARLLDALPASGLPAGEVRALQDKYADLRKAAAARAGGPGLQTLREAGPGLSVRGLPVTPAQWAATGLQAQGPDANPDWMRCTAKQPLDDLQPFRLAPGVRRGAAVADDAVCYLLPVDRLELPPAHGPTARESKAAS
ncbi:hypothetical protein ACT80S_05535 [Ramlibacter sp. MAHUQ-53]|uniref:hypothetical protein n=1 Tax=unclassified Ramlibacter TaxID=2617605 RepID=UPI003636B6F1